MYCLKLFIFEFCFLLFCCVLFGFLLVILDSFGVFGCDNFGDGLLDFMFDSVIFFIIFWCCSCNEVGVVGEEFG